MRERRGKKGNPKEEGFLTQTGWRKEFALNSRRT